MKDNIQKLYNDYVKNELHDILLELNDKEIKNLKPLRDFKKELRIKKINNLLKFENY